MKELFNKYKQIITYIIFGVLTTIVNIITYKLFRLIGVYYVISNIIAWIASVLFAYFTNKKWVFESKTNTKKETFTEFIKFITARLASLGVDMVLMILFIDLLKINEDISKIGVNVIVIVVNYVLSKVIVFKK